jgi:hypothetical protein
MSLLSIVVALLQNHTNMLSVSSERAKELSSSVKALAILNETLIMSLKRYFLRKYPINSHWMRLELMTSAVTYYCLSHYATGTDDYRVNIATRDGNAF